MGVSREQFMASVGAVDNFVQKLVVDSYENHASNDWSNELEQNPHGQPWHTSFHASSFPGDDPKACPRKSLYTMMGFPKDKKHSHRSISIMDAGKDIEARIVTMLHENGVLLSNPPWHEHQTGFEDRDVWLTGSVDAIVLPPGWTSPHAIEVKTKSHEHVQAMIDGQRSWDDPHRRQLLTYIAMLNMESKKLWPDLKPVRDGTILYVSRAEPSVMMEYYFELDEAFFDEGKRKLAEWRDMFMEGVIPPRPKDWKWTDLPCKWCDHKKHTCKPDDKQKIEMLMESHGRAWAENVYGEYDGKAVRDSVLERWQRDG